MKAKFINVFLIVAFAMVAMGSFVSCKDYDEDMYADLSNQNASLQEILNGQITELKGLQTQLNELKATCTSNYNSLKAELEKLQSDVNGNSEDILKLINRISVVETDIQNLQKAQDLLTARVDALENANKAQQLSIDQLVEQINGANGIASQITSILKSVAQLEEKIGNNTTAITKLQEDFAKIIVDNNTIRNLANDALELAKADSVRLDKLEKLCETFVTNNTKTNARIDSLAKVTKDMQSEIDNILLDVEKKYNDAKAYTDQRIAEAKAELSQMVNAQIDGKLEDLTNAYKSADQMLQYQITVLQGDFSTLNSSIEACSLKIDKLQGLFTNALAKLITSVIIQGTYNPVFGSASLPLDVSSNVLVAYYGYAPTYGVSFPTGAGRYYADGEETLTSKDLAMLNVTPFTKEAGDCLISDAADNAGTLYLTVNPNTVDFSGVSFSLVNSRDVESGVKLGTLKKSDHTLTFGYSRSSEDNGFYEAPAKLEEKDIQSVKARINIEDIKSAVKDVLDRKDGINVSKVASTLYTSFNGFLDANAVKATYTNPLNDKQAMSTYTKYALAATAVKPLSYAFDYQISKLPGIDRVDNFIGNLINKINIKLPTFTTAKPNISHIRITPFDQLDHSKFKTTVTITGTVDVPGQTISGDDIYIYYMGVRLPVSDIKINGTTATFTASGEVDLTEAVRALYGDLTQPLEDVNKMIDEINKYLDDVQSFIGQIDDLQTQIDNIKEEIKNQLTNYLNTFNSKVCNIINSAHKALQPVLLVKTTSSFARLSQAMTIPTKIPGGNFIMVPTSYTAEIIAPAYKKLVGVTNVYSLDLTQNAQDNGGKYKVALDNANKQADVDEILDGGKLDISFSAQKGFIYEIVYTAVDYSGKVVAKKFYVEAVD